MKIPLVTDMPMLDNVGYIDIITNDPSGPFGAKESGEGSGASVIAAVANAVYDATKVRFRTIPMTPEKILAELQESDS